MDRMQGTSNQQEQTPQGPQRPTPLPTTYAAPRQRTRQELDFDDDGQLTIIDVPILSPRRDPAPVDDAPEEVVPEEAAPAEEVELIPEPQQNVAELAPIAPPPQHHAPYYPQWQYPPQLLNYWYGPQMNQPAYFHQAQGPVVPQYGQLGSLEYYDADGNLPGPSNASPAPPPPPPPPQNFFGEYGYGYLSQPAHHSGLARFPVATAPEAYGAPIRPEDPSIPQIQAPTPGQYQDPVQAPDVVNNWEVYVPEGEPVEMEDVDGIEMGEEYEVLDMEEVEEEEVAEEEDEELLSSGEEASDGESGNDLDLGNFSGIDLDLDLPVNEEQMFQALDDEEEEERKKGEEGEEKEDEEQEEEEGEVALVEIEEEEDLEKESKKQEQEEKGAEAARRQEDLDKMKAEEEKKNQELIKKLLEADRLDRRRATLRNRKSPETNKRKLSANEEKAQEELKNKAQRNRMQEFEEGISNDPNAPEIEQLLRSMGLHYFQARPVVSRRRRYESESEDENYDPEESRRPRRKQQAKRRRPNKRQ